MNGKAVIFCAPSGAGKTTIVKHLIQQVPELSFSISATTRAPREGVEQHGRDYYFLSATEFVKQTAEGAMLEWQEVYTNVFYGTLKSEVERIWNEGKHVIFDVDVVGGLNLKRALKEQALSIFVNAESVDVLRHRLEYRGTESQEAIDKRIAKAEEEMSFAPKFDYELINRDLQDAFTEAEQVVREFLK